MLQELNSLTEKVGLTSHIKALMKETFIKRKTIIDALDSIHAVVSQFPFLLNADMVIIYLFSIIYQSLLRAFVFFCPGGNTLCTPAPNHSRVRNGECGTPTH